MSYWENEREDLLQRFVEELRKATGDGSKKRQAGEKPPWYKDGSHEGAIFSHITKWKRGEKVDPDSGAHPLVHTAWRALAIACTESGNVPSLKEALREASLKPAEAVWYEEYKPEKTDPFNPYQGERL